MSVLENRLCVRISQKKTAIFNFEVNKQQFFFKNVTDNIILHLVKASESVAVLYFSKISDISNEKINIEIPEGIQVYTYNERNQKILEKPVKDSQQYVLCWTDDYVVEYHDTTLCKMISKRAWDILH